jgi:membrane-associated protease RseP (regulator of RpoE activity)
MLNMDMIGRSIPVEAEDKTMKDRLVIWGTGTAEGMKTFVDNTIKGADLKVTALASGTGPSDHDSFYRKQIPILFFYTGTHGDYHRPADTPDKINYSAMRKVVDLAETVATHFSTVPEKPKYTETRERWADPTEAPRGGGGTGRGFSVTLGVRMNYEDEGPGILIDGVTPNGPAEKAGVKEGDRITEMAGKPVANVAAYTAQLGTLRAGTEIEIKVVHKDKKEEKLKITPQASGMR